MIAPDKFAGTLTAVEAAEAIADGWRSVDPDTHCTLVPLSDGGPGFVDVLHTALGGTRVATEATGPLGTPVQARFLLVGQTAYVESAQACGLHLLPAKDRNPETTTTYGVGELIGAAIDRGATTVVVGLGGSGTNDGGAGMLAALGATPAEPLRSGGGALTGLDRVDLAAARARVAGIRLIAATDVDNPLLGAHGASAVFGPQKGADAAQVQRLDAALAHFADLTDPETTLRATPGAGAAGGLGYGLLLLGGTVESGVRRVLGAVGLDTLVASADAVITGEGSFDSQSLRGKLPHGVAQTASRHGVPCVVLAGRVAVAEEEAAAAGVTAAHSLVESAGSVQAALEHSARELRRLAARVAADWPR